MTAAAHKFACIVYHIGKTHHECNPTVFRNLERRIQDRRRMKLQPKPRELGFELVPRETASFDASSSLRERPSASLARKRFSTTRLDAKRFFSERQQTP
jgi:hypothetical protein